MWSRLYRNHVIMPFPSYDTTTNSWAPQVNITWCLGPSRESEFVRFPNRFTTEAEAITCALRRGRAWVDNRLRRSRSVSRSRSGSVIEMIGALKERLEKANPEQPRQAQLPKQRWPEETFTFDHFKFVIAERGLKISEQKLQKSYAALVKLRKNKRWSWAETKRKVKDSQQNLGAARSRRGPKAARIPLTERDWRRIG